MNIYYAKSILYSYKSLDAVMEQIDELVLKKAMASAMDFSPCEEQCEKIIDYTYQKDMLITLKLVVDSVLKKFTEEDILYFDYKYFREKPKEFYVNFDYTGRSYFRRQIRLANDFARRVEKAGIDDKWYEENCLQTDFFKELLKRVKEHESISYKNKSKKDIEKKTIKIA